MPALQALRLAVKPLKRERRPVLAANREPSKANTANSSCSQQDILEGTLMCLQDVECTFAMLKLDADM
ncbi:hypothetical protein KSC_025030 [Ktedonobacter sp. SOSP1-52]|nr:hypothetical protein KSC_025030 [Ktedonobacter sp. SOSP1-52]